MTTDLIGSARACELLGIDRSTLSRWVQSGKIIPALRLPGETGAMLFRPSDVAALSESETATA